MGLLERTRKNFTALDPTGEWRRAALLRLEVDLKRPSLNGVALGESLSSLCFLGPVEQRDPRCPEEFCYPSLGLVIESIDDEAFTGFQLVVADRVFRPAFAPFSGDCRCGDELPALCGMTETQWTAALGESYWRDADEDEVILFYEFAYHELQVEFTLAGELKCIIVTGSALMADEAQRRAYGVTRPWPPENVPAG